MRRAAIVAITIALASLARAASAAPPSCAKVEKKMRRYGRVRQLLAVAQCNHRAGRYTAAWYGYTEAAARARQAHDKRSLKIAEKGIQQNAGLLVWITVVSDSDSDELDVDGDKTVSGAKKALDPGKHTVHATGPGREPWSKTLELQSGDVEEVTVPPGRAAGPDAPEAAASPSPSPSPSPSSPASSAPEGGASAARESTASQTPSNAEPARSGEPAAPEPHTGVVADIDALVELYDEVPAGKTDRESGQAFVFVATAGYDFTPSLRAFARLGLVDNYAPGRAHAASLSNAALGASYDIWALPWLRVGAEAGLVLPIGSGSGNSPSPGIASANVRGRALYPTLFDTNYLTPWLGVRAESTLARVVGRLEASINPSIKTSSASADRGKTRLILGAHAGYQVLPLLEPFVEVRWFRFVSEPSFVAADPAQADNLFGGLGVALTFAPLRAQIAYLRALDEPLTRDHFSAFALRLGLEF